MPAPSSSAPIAETRTASLVRTSSRTLFSPSPVDTMSHLCGGGKPAHLPPQPRVFYARGQPAPGRRLLAVVVPFESQPASIDRLTELVAADMGRVNQTILSRTGSNVTMIPEVANHLIG